MSKVTSVTKHNASEVVSMIQSAKTITLCSKKSNKKYFEYSSPFSIRILAENDLLTNLAKLLNSNIDEVSIAIFDSLSLITQNVKCAEDSCNV